MSGSPGGCWPGGAASRALLGSPPPPGLARSTLDLEAMQEAAGHLLGTHDFSAFQSAGSPALSTLRTLRRACVGPAPASPFLLPQESR